MKSRFQVILLSVALCCLLAACGSDDSKPAAGNPGPVPGHGSSRIGHRLPRGRHTLTGRLVFSEDLMRQLGREVIPAANCVQLVIPPKAAPYVRILDGACKAQLVQWSAQGIAERGARPTAPLRHWEILDGTRAIGRFDAKVFKRPDGTQYAAYEIAELCTGTYSGCRLNVVDGAIRGLR